VELSPGRDCHQMDEGLNALLIQSKEIVEHIWASQTFYEALATEEVESRGRQLALFE